MPTTKGDGRYCYLFPQYVNLVLQCPALPYYNMTWHTCGAWRGGGVKVRCAKKAVSGFGGMGVGE